MTTIDRKEEKNCLIVLIQPKKFSFRTHNKNDLWIFSFHFYVCEQQQTGPMAQACFCLLVISFLFVCARPSTLSSHRFRSRSGGMTFGTEKRNKEKTEERREEKRKEKNRRPHELPNNVV